MKAVIVFSGGLDSVCTVTYLQKKYDLYGITFSYGQKADKEIKVAKQLSKLLKFKEYKVVDISFMKDLYEKTNALTNSEVSIPSKFNYSIVAPIRNAIFLSIASAWAFSKKAQLVAYGAHLGDKKYPDCKPTFTKLLSKALNEGEKDGIKLGLRKEIRIWSPFMSNLSKSDLLIHGYKKLGSQIFKSWSCYGNSNIHCGKCESCNNRKLAFLQSKIIDKTKYISKI